VKLIELKCANCGSQLLPEDVSPQLAAARCRHCNALFAIPAAAGAAAIGRPEVTLPSRFRIERDMESLRITRKWFSPVAFFLLFFAVFWNGFMIVWHAIALGTGMWVMSAFGLIHTGIGIGLIYVVLAKFLNTTVITANKFELSVISGPLPWRGNKRIEAGQVRQLYCKEKVSHGKNGASVSYSVEAVMNDNTRQTLAAGFENSDQALFVEQQIERHLGIADVPVAGEHGR
jgi:hypothetical protein